MRDGDGGGIEGREREKSVGEGRIGEGVRVY